MKTIFISGVSSVGKTTIKPCFKENSKKNSCISNSKAKVNSLLNNEGIKEFEFIQNILNETNNKFLEKIKKLDKETIKLLIYKILSLNYDGIKNYGKNSETFKTLIESVKLSLEDKKEILIGENGVFSIRNLIKNPETFKTLIESKKLNGEDIKEILIGENGAFNIDNYSAIILIGNGELFKTLIESKKLNGEDIKEILIGENGAFKTNNYSARNLTENLESFKFLIESEKLNSKDIKEILIGENGAFKTNIYSARNLTENLLIFGAFKESKKLNNKLIEEIEFIARLISHEIIDDVFIERIKNLDRETLKSLIYKAFKTNNESVKYLTEDGELFNILIKLTKLNGEDIKEILIGENGAFKTNNESAKYLTEDGELFKTLIESKKLNGEDIKEILIGENGAFKTNIYSAKNLIENLESFKIFKETKKINNDGIEEIEFVARLISHEIDDEFIEKIKNLDREKLKLLIYKAFKTNNESAKYLTEDGELLKNLIGSTKLNEEDIKEILFNIYKIKFSEKIITANLEIFESLSEIILSGNYNQISLIKTEKLLLENIGNIFNKEKTIIKQVMNIINIDNIYLINLLEKKYLNNSILKEYLIKLLKYPYYYNQNINGLINNLEYINENNKEKIDELITIMGGCITKVLLKKYLTLNSKDDRKKLILEYKRDLKEILSSKKININSNTNKELLAETIYLAYRPTGYTEKEIIEILNAGKIKDYTDRLKNIKYKKEGYKAFIGTAEYSLKNLDLKEFQEIDKILFSDNTIDEYIKNKKEYKEIDQRKMFVLILKKYNEDRIKSYIDKYKNKSKYDKIRYEMLGEILKIIPKEPEFEKYLKEYFEKNNKIKELLNDYIDTKITGRISCTLKRTGEERLNKQERKYLCDNNNNEIIEFVEKLLNPNIKDEYKLGVKIKMIKDKINTKTKKGKNYINELLRKFICYKIREKGLLISEEQKTKIIEFIIGKYSLKKKTGIEKILYDVKDESKRIQKIYNNESNKITKECEGKEEEINFVLSMNIGSFFAKAGAELCTSKDICMWDEERHIHLNMIQNNQIIGVIMLYFEQGRDYLIVRGFNPRVDTLEKFDTKQLTQAMIKIVRQIANKNGYDKIYIPEQGSWHALSNRDQVNKEVWNISRQNKNKEDYCIKTEFYCSQLNIGYKVNELYLL